MTDVQSNSHRVGSVTATRTGDIVRVEDRSCDACPACRSGRPLWCTHLGAAREVAAPVTALTPEEVLRSLCAAAAFTAARIAPDATVLVIDDATGPLSLGELLPRLHPGPVVATADAADPQARARIAEISAHGRADAAVVTYAARAAVKSVLRGGTVCLPADPVDAPSVTELVQREVRLVGARSLLDVLARAA
jgi:D-arabinose 1-dehydrogenase-like Zn-dependent alcohol dehydrogenase